MRKITVTHRVENIDNWIGYHDERVLLFSKVATDLVSYVDAEGSNNIAVSMTVTDPEGFDNLMKSVEIAEARQRHGVLPPIVVFSAVS